MSWDEFRWVSAPPVWPKDHWTGFSARSQSHAWFREDSWAPAQSWSFVCPPVAGETKQPWSPYGPVSVAALESPLVCHLSDAGKGFVANFLYNCPSALTATDSWGTCREPYNRNISSHWHQSVWEMIDKITFKRVALLVIKEDTNLKENGGGYMGGIRACTGKEEMTQPCYNLNK